MRPEKREEFKARYDSDPTLQKQYPNFDQYAIKAHVEEWQEEYKSSAKLREAFRTFTSYFGYRVPDEEAENEYYASEEIRAQFPTAAAYITYIRHMTRKNNQSELSVYLKKVGSRLSCISAEIIVEAGRTQRDDL